MALKNMAVMSLASSPVEADQAGYFSQLWMRTLESMMYLIRANSGNTTIVTDGATALQYQGDLYGLFNKLAVPARYQWLIMRMNGFDDPVQYDGSVFVFTKPDFAYIEKLRSLFQTTLKKNS